MKAGAVTVGAVNFHGAWGDKAENLRRIEAHSREAAKVGIQILAFPELALSGYECGECDEGDPCAVHLDAAEEVPGPSSEALADLAAELDMYLIVGMPEIDADDSDKRYISALVVGPEGILGTYRKLYLGRPPLHRESVCFSSGDEVPVFETRYGTIGVAICADFWIVPEITRLMVLKGADIVFNIAGSTDDPGKTEFMEQQTGSRATESQIYTVSANRIGREGDLEYYGHSTIAGAGYPRLNRFLARSGYAEEIVHATLTPDSLKVWQDEILDVRNNVNWAVMAREYAAAAERQAERAAERPPQPTDSTRRSSRDHRPAHADAR